MADKDSRKKNLKERRRAQILKAALDIFSRKGYAAATVPEIAGAAGVAAGTIYLYYAGKRELFVAVIKSFIITIPLLKLIDNIPQGNINDVFKNILKNRLDLIDNPSFARLPALMADVQRDPELKALWIKDFLHPFLGKMAPGYSYMAAAGKFRRLEPEIAVRVVGGMVIGFLLLRVIEGANSPLNKMDRDKVAEEVVDLILHGLMDDTGKKPGKDGAL